MKECLEINAEALEELQDMYGDNSKIQAEIVEAMNNTVQYAEENTSILGLSNSMWLLYNMYLLFKK